MKRVKNGYSIVLMNPDGNIITCNLDGVSENELSDKDMMLKAMEKLIESLPNEAFENK